MSEHTPGPWTVTHRHAGRSPAEDECCGLGLDIEGPPEAMNRGQFARAADARLIAASPEMYDELQECITDLVVLIGNITAETNRCEVAASRWEGVIEHLQERVRSSRAAITKATTPQ